METVLLAIVTLLKTLREYRFRLPKFIGREVVKIRTRNWRRNHKPFVYFTALNGEQPMYMKFYKDLEKIKNRGGRL
jgi:hypothetical protein